VDGPDDDVPAAAALSAFLTRMTPLFLTACSTPEAFDKAKSGFSSFPFPVVDVESTCSSTAGTQLASSRVTAGSSTVLGGVVYRLILVVSGSNRNGFNEDWT